MATTDSKTGFRLPWSADRGETGSPADARAEDPLTGGDLGQAQQPETSQLVDARPSASDQPATAKAEAVRDAPAPGLSVPARRPNKFMADLTRAMQVAAETARADTLSRFANEAKTHIEGIHASTATEATELRKKADDDVTAIREWSKAEIGRIREETDERITHRKNVLEREVEAHAGEIEARIELVQRRVVAFETGMTAFFERLLAEEDPTRFAAMAESLPEPPPFDPDEAWEPERPIGDAGAAAMAAAPAPEAVAESPEATAIEATIDSPAESASDPARAITAMTPPESIDADNVDVVGVGVDDPSGQADADPRLQVLGLDADFAAAEAEAAEAEAADFSADGATSDEDIPVIADDALAARLAGLVPDVESAATDSTATRVVVTGLISVAAIAGFKRHLSRLTGVRSVGVSSGPDGEFVFAIVHDRGLALGDAIATLPGFAARVMNQSDGEMTVAARDPEAEG